MWKVNNGAVAENIEKQGLSAIKQKFKDHFANKILSFQP